jgi:hypothetical protein
MIEQRTGCAPSNYHEHQTGPGFLPHLRRVSVPAKLCGPASNKQIIASSMRPLAIRHGCKIFSRKGRLVFALGSGLIAK